VTVELQYLDVCPNHEALSPHLEWLPTRLADDDAWSERLLGAPSVRVDDHDVEPRADDRDDFGLRRRLFRTPSGVCGRLFDEWEQDAVSGASA
jgi:hypothetical protein